MSRCLPYPLPGYERKGQLLGTREQPINPVLSSKKKDKHKHNEKDKKAKKKRRKEIDHNGDVQDKEKHWEAEFGGVKHVLQKSSISAQAMNHHRPGSFSDQGHLRNGRIQELESVDSGCDNGGKAEQSLRYEEVADFVAPAHSNNGQVCDIINKHSARHSGNGLSFGVIQPLDSESCHPNLKPLHKEREALNGELDHLKPVARSRPLSFDSNTEALQPTMVDSKLNSRSGKRRHSNFKGFFEFAPLPQQDEWSADCESWIFPTNDGDDALNFEVEVGCHNSQVLANAPLRTSHVNSNQRRKIELKDENPQVWAEACFLPSAGLHALPYVVPY
ncbi:hypothetical protein O6H91_12G041900 [Diphasiastrum complanatum]|uniref:Uncharacterized protein n=2 Tax=Diphasiastrum complanatum TaxID=34168 RepID=A0ACC2C1H0_DIPCM|nr:hypothetical protein O6H91_12G041900 [Diphasiastrum complanatum]KAJ7535659.1 hypothetical protein O6H91_12G041900 [Diphasiastrum complanatum]